MLGVDNAVPLLQVEDLRVSFTAGRGRQRRTVKAVDGVSLQIRDGETLGLVGESGCGKTTLVRTILGLTPPTGGAVRLGGTDFAHLGKRAQRELRPTMQVVFQDPYSALNPRMSVHELIAEPLRLNDRYSAARVDELLEQVGLDPVMGDRLPATFSGGQRQRIGIARALALEPKLLVLDEPVSALDVSVQAQVINLLQRLQSELGLSYLFIAHDLGLVRRVSHRIAVMYLGRIVEQGPPEQIFQSPKHPYTRSLLDSIPISHPSQRGTRARRQLLDGEPPDPANPPSGCAFRTRCQYARDECAVQAPPLTDSNGSAMAETHLAACYFPLDGPALLPAR